MVVYNPFDHATADNPYPIYRQLRDDAPVYHNEEIGFYALTRYEDVLAASLDPATYSSAEGVTLEGIDKGQPFLILKDPPEHTWHRKIVSRVFTPRRVEGLEPFIRQTAGDLLDQHVASGTFDAVEQFSMRLPLNVISELIGIPEDDREMVHILSDRVAARDGSATAPDDVFKALIELHQLFVRIVEARRGEPGDDVISLIMNSEVEDGEGGRRAIDDDEVAHRFIELAFAGHETVAKLIANGIVALAWNPDQRAELVADPTLIPNAVEEMLRWDPPSHYQGRWTTRDVELHGTVIPADSRVILVTGAAGHDERRYPDPERFDIHRAPDRHVSFGFGVHLCLGASLARLETRIAFEELLARFPDYAIADEGVKRQYSGNVRGLEALPLLGTCPFAGVEAGAPA